MIAFFRRLRDCTSGAALLEATIIFPLVLVLMVGVIDLGRAIQDYHTAEKSMRSAARYLARVPAEGVCNWGLANARNLALYGTINPPTDPQPLVRGWTDPNTVALAACTGTPGNPLTLVLTADVQIPTPLISAIGLPSTVTMSVRHEERHIGG